MMKGKKLLWLAGAAAIAVIAALVLLLMPRTPQLSANQQAFLDKADRLKAEVVTDETVEALGESPVESVGHVVFLSVSDGATRAKVYKGTGKALSDAWDQAAQRAARGVGDDAGAFRWLRADVVNSASPTDPNALMTEVINTLSGFDFNGLALDAKFKTALVEGQLNGWRIYDYKKNSIPMKRLNQCLEENGEKPVEKIPDDLTGFTCWGWFCDEDGTVYRLCREGADTGRREVPALDADYARNIIDTASAYLVEQVQPDGKFIYGIRPQFDKEIDDYNILRHSGTIWSLICRYRMFPDEALKGLIESTIGYTISQIRYDEDGAGYMYEADDDEIKLGGNGIAVVAMTEYMDLFQNEDYREVCEALGEGILKQQGDDGSYWHVLTGDFEKKESFRTVYYDGECTFALTRLYRLTGEQKWLDAACKAIDHFIAEDYTQYRDHWVAYSLNEATKYVDRQDYYDFALANATNNFARILGRSRTYPTNLELLISSFETWQRMVDNGIDTGDFEVQDLLDVIAARANRQLSGYFYPELAMYMQNPQRILGSFMMRDDRFRVRIDDVQHNIGGFYLYWKNYDAMLAAGLDPSIMDGTKDS